MRFGLRVRSKQHGHGLCSARLDALWPRYVCYCEHVTRIVITDLVMRLWRGDAELETDGVDGLIDEIAQWRGSLEVRPDDFVSSSVGARFYPLMYILTRVNDARDLQNGLSLSHRMLGLHSNLHVHHIFPKPSRVISAGIASLKNDS